MKDFFKVSPRQVKFLVAAIYLYTLLTILKIFVTQDIKSYLMLLSMLTTLGAIHILKVNFKLPPGPTGLPFIGILFFIKKDFHLLLFDYFKSFGNIVSFRMGSETIIVLNDYKVIKKAFQSKDFTFRPKNTLSQILGGYGIVNSEGDLWRSQRRFLLKQKLGMKYWHQGIRAIESLVHAEAVNMMEAIQTEYKGQPVNPSSFINCAISNVICSMMMSKRFQHRDPQFERFMHLFDEGFRLFTLTGPLVFFPILKHIPGVSSAFTQLKANREEMLTFVKGIISEHRQDIDYNNPKDLVDAYLVEIDQLQLFEEKTNIFHGFDTDTQVAQIVLDLFSAGVETLKTSLLWALVYMLHYPEVLKKVQKELDDVVSFNELPSLDDIENLPYTRATIYEIMRRSSVVPMGTTHANSSQDVEFEGFRIPKNAHVIPLLYTVHMNPDYWNNPEEFRPERFLSADCTKVIKPEHFIPFGVGQRMCLGDNLAEKEFFLFFSILMQQFDIQNPHGVPLPGLKGIVGVTVTPEAFEVVFHSRRMPKIIL